jgi:hypothetical protein
MFHNSYLFASAFLSFILCLSGCTKAPATASGKVSLDGQPLSSGSISFIPNAGGAIAQGTIQSNGNYRLQTGTDAGLQPGEYLVTVAATKPLPPAAPNAPEPLPELLTPKKYNAKETTDLKCTVKGGANTFDFDLKSK